MDDELFLRAMDQYVGNRLNSGQDNVPTVRKYLGTWAGAMAGDADLSNVVLQGGTWLRNVPKLGHVTGLVAGQTVILESTPTTPTHIVGVLKGGIKAAAIGSTDTDPPTVPASLTPGTATMTTQPLSWLASSDDVAVVAYDVFVNDAYRLSVIGTSTTVSGLSAGVTYSYKVRARDAAGNVSGFSNVVTQATAADSGPPPGSTYTRQYAATWSGTYGEAGGNEYNSYYGNEAHQGQYGGGNRKSLIGGFTTSTAGTAMATDLAGASPVGARVRLTYFHWYSFSGGTAVVGTHSNASRPGSFTGTNTNRVQSGGWPAGTTRWVDLGYAVCSEFISGTTKGIALGPGPSGSNAYYGKAYGAGSGVYVPILELTFVK